MNEANSRYLIRFNHAIHGHVVAIIDDTLVAEKSDVLMTINSEKFDPLGSETMGQYIDRTREARKIEEDRFTVVIDRYKTLGYKYLREIELNERRTAHVARRLKKKISTSTVADDAIWKNRNKQGQDNENIQIHENIKLLRAH